MSSEPARHRTTDAAWSTRNPLRAWTSSSPPHLNLMAGSERVSIYLSVPSGADGPLPGEARAAIEHADHVVLDLSTRALDAIGPARSSGATIWTDLHDYDGESDFHQPFLAASLSAGPARGDVGDALKAGAVQAVRALGSRNLSPLLDGDSAR